MRKRLSPKILIGIPFAAIVFGYLGYRAYHGVQHLLQTGIHFTPGYLLISLLCQFVSVALAAWVWSDILRCMGYPSSFWFDLQAFGASALARKLPGTVWYAVGRLAIYSRVKAPKTPVVLAMIVEAVVISLAGLIDFAIVVGSGVAALTALSPKLVVLLPLAPALVVASVVFGPRLIRYATRKTQRRLAGAESEPGPLLPIRHRDVARWLVGWSVVVALGAGVAFFLARSIDANIAISFAPMLGAWGIAVSLGPVAMWLPGDIGLKDGVMYLIISPVVGGPMAAVVTLAWRLWVSLLEVLFGLACGAMLGWRMGLFQPGSRETGLISRYSGGETARTEGKG